MKISFNNTLNTNTNKTITNHSYNKSHNYSFKGAGKDNYAFYSLDLSSIFNNPLTILYHQLTKDGFSKTDIEDMRIFHESNPDENERTKRLVKEFKLLDRHSVNSGFYYPPKPKSNDDILSMLSIYKSLSLKFVTEDVEEYNDAFIALDTMLEQNFGVRTQQDKHIKDLVLGILKYTNRYNAPITEALLDDPDFNNTNIIQAIMGIKNKEQANSAMKVYNMAKQTGYNKDFSLPLAVMINKANKKNLPAIAKAMTEQDYLLADKDFVPQKLDKFLSRYDYLTISYIKDDNLTLRDISSIIETTQ